MKTIILCGGRGWRLDGQTEFKPKPLVEIGGIPILWHIMKHYSHQGHREFILPLGYRGEAIKEYFLRLNENSLDFVLDLEDNSRKFLSEENSLDGKIYFIDTKLESSTGSRISQVRKYVEGEEDFFLTYGDAVSDMDLNSLYEQHKKSGVVLTITGVVPSYQFGVIKSNGGMATTYEEKPSIGNQGYINGGYMVCNQRIFDYLSDEESCVLERGPMERLVDEKMLGVYSHKGFWHCMDTQKDVDKLNKIWSNSAPWKIWD